MISLQSSDYALSITSIDPEEEEFLPELAFIGRSNVGKSTFLNRITSRKKLASTSSKPGHTRKINLFNLKISKDGKKGIDLQLADLPGYGFAKLSKKERTFLNRLIVEYVQGRAGLQLVCILNDIRRKPSEDDIAIRDLCAERGVGVLVIATKSDKVKQGERGKLRKSLAAAYHLQPQDILLSALNAPPEEFWERAEGYLEFDE